MSLQRHSREMPLPPPASPPPPSPPSSQPSPSPASPFVSVRCSLTAHLHPRHLGSVEDGIRSQLNELLLCYHPSVRGVVLGFSRIRLLASCGRILFDRPFVHVPIAVQLLVLGVEPQQTRLQATVSRVAADHLTLLVLGVLPAVVRKADIPACYRFTHSAGEDGRPEPRMVDTRLGERERGSGREASFDGLEEEKELSGKQQAKLRKRQQKEERRQAFLAAQRGAEEGKEGKEDADSASASAAAGHHDIRVGSRVVFLVQAVRQSDGFLSLSGSLSAAGCGLIPGPPVVLPGWKEMEEEERQREQELRQDGRRAEQSVSVDGLFGREEEQQRQEEEAKQEQQTGEEAAVPLAAAESGELPMTAARLSKKELREGKRAAKQQRRADKAERRRARLSGAAVAPSSSVPSTAPLNGSATAAAERSAASVRQQEREVKQEMEAQGLQAEDDGQQPEDFSHVEQHLITDEHDDSSSLGSVDKKRAVPEGSEQHSGQHKRRRKEGRERDKSRTPMRAAGSE